MKLSNTDTQPLPRIFRPHRPLTDGHRPLQLHKCIVWQIWHGLLLNPLYCLVSHFTRIVPYFTLPLPASVKFHQNFATFCLLLYNLQIADSLDLGFERVFLCSSLKKLRIKYKDDYFWLYWCWRKIEYWTCEYIAQALN